MIFGVLVGKIRWAEGNNEVRKRLTTCTLPDAGGAEAQLHTFLFSAAHEAY